MRKIWKQLWRTVDGFLAPNLCPVCRKTTAPERGICEECEEQFPQLPAERCPLCGGPLGQFGFLEICRECSEAGGHPWYRGVAAFPFSGLARKAVHQLKYQKQTSIVPFLAGKMAEAWRRYGSTAKPEVIVPVPLHWTRQWSRGFNQSALLAEWIGKELQLPVVNALRRIRRTSRQAGLSRTDRGKNLKNAFQISRPDQIRDKSVLLIDDVLTTGNTLEENSAVLLQHGAAEVSVLTIARD